MTKKTSKTPQNFQKPSINSTAAKSSTKTETGKMNKESQPSEPKERFTWSKQKTFALLPALLMAFLFLGISHDWGVTIIDPWYKAIQMVDSARQVTDTTIKNKLLNEGGSKLKELTYKFHHPKVEFFLGYYFYQIQQWDSAVYYCRSAFKADSGATMNPIWQDAMRFYVYSALNQSVVLINKNDNQKALICLKEIEPLSPDNPDLENNLGLVYLKLNNLPEASKRFKRAYELNPKHTTAKLNLIGVLQQMGDIKSVEALSKQ